MKSEWKRTLSVFLLVLVVVLALSAAVPNVSAWELSVTPATATVAAGGQTTFTVSITGTIAGNPSISLELGFVGEAVSGLGATFFPNHRSAPFVSTLTIYIQSSVSPRELHLRVTAYPERTEGPQSRDITVIVLGPWNLGITPSSRDVGPGGSTTFTVYVTGAIAGNPNVHLYGLAQISGPFHFSVNDRPAPFTSTMTVNVASIAAPGSYILTVYADPTPAEPPKSKQVTLNVITLTATIPWSVSVSPTSKSVPQGASTSYTVSVTGTISGNPNVHLMIGSPVIVGMTFSFSVNDRPAPFTSMMTVSVASTVGPSDYSRTIIAHPDSGSADKTASFHVVVQAPSMTTWDLSVTPMAAAIAPGHTASFMVSVTGSIPGNPNVELLVSPSVLGITSSFSTNYRPAPFNSIMTVSVDASKTLGDYALSLWAHPASALFPGPDNKALNVHILVGAAATTTAFDFSISSLPTEQTIPSGGSTTYTITVSLVSGSSENVALSVSGAPSDASTSLNPISGLPSFNSVLSISTTSSVAPGQYTITITGTAGTISHTATVTLTVAQSTDFRIDVDPASQTSTQGETTSYSVNVVSLNGFNSIVALTVEGLPAGVGGTFTMPSSVPDYSSTLTLTIPSNSPTGSFALIITGSGAGITHMAKVVLVINPAQVEEEAETKTQTQAQTLTTKHISSSPVGVPEMLQQNSLIIIASLALLAILLALLLAARRRRRSAPQQHGVASRILCSKCGSENRSSNEFCSHCGNRLESRIAER